MAQRIGSRSLRSLDPVRCLPPTLPSKCFVWCYGPEFVARDLRKWLANTGAKTLYIEPGSPWENGYCESFNSKLRDEFLNGEIFYSMKEIRILAERWRVHYNTVRPHSSLGYRPPAPESWQTEIKTGYGEVESKLRFPLPHTLDGGHLITKEAALH
jgi:putative transposase